MTEQTLEQADIPDITVVVVNYNTGHLLDRLFCCACRRTRRAYEFRRSWSTMHRGITRLKFCAADIPTVGSDRKHNKRRLRSRQQSAVPSIRGRYVLLLNTDAFVSPDTLFKTLNFMESNPQCGILGVKLVGEDGSLQPSCRFFPTPWNVFLTSTGLDRFFPNTRLVDDMKWDHNKIRECDWVPGCYYFTRKQLVDQIGLFDPRFFLYYEEVDHCRRAHQAGWRVYFYPNTQVVHIGGESAKTDAPLTSAGRQIERLQIESELLYVRKHYGLPGLAASVFLTTSGWLLAGLKDIFAPANPNGRRALKEKLATVFSLLAATRLASRGTR